jgi:EAL domain-containing protein (putative c-di-GMP-specific phosphodiesterase class I)
VVSVETDEELNLLGNLGVDGVQGYGVGRPEER